MPSSALRHLPRRSIHYLRESMPRAADLLASEPSSVTALKLPGTVASPFSVKLQQSRGIAADNLRILGGSHADLVHQFQPFKFQRYHGRRVRTKQEVILAHRLQGALGRWRPIAGGVEIQHLQVMTRWVTDHHRLVFAKEHGKVEQFVGIIHAADDFANAPTEMAANDFHRGKLLKNPAYDEAGQGEAIVGGAADARCKPVIRHRRCRCIARMNKHRNVEISDELPERTRYVLVRVMPMMTGID